MKFIALLPTGSEEREVLGVESIPDAILNKTPLRPQYTLGHYTYHNPTGLGQYDGLREYYGPHTASSEFLVIIIIIPYFSHTCCLSISDFLLFRIKTDT